MLTILLRNKRAIKLDLRSEKGVEVLKQLASNADVLIDPYRPGVLERLGLGPKVLLKLNPRLIFARLTGFRRDGEYKDMAGHDINYMALSGALSILGRFDQKPYSPGNLLADFAGGGLMCALGIIMALFKRTKNGKGDLVEVNMVDGARYLATFPLHALNGPFWGQERGRNILDGGSPFYDTYETKDGKFMSV